jgi:2EXR family
VAEELRDRTFLFEYISYPNKPTSNGSGLNRRILFPFLASHSTGMSTLTIGNQEGGFFTLFPKLSAELRIKIWKWVCFEPRSVDLWEVRVCDKYSPRYPGFIVYKTNSTTPAILQWCWPQSQILSPSGMSISGKLAFVASTLPGIRDSSERRGLELLGDRPFGLSVSSSWISARISTQLLPGGPWGHGNTPLAGTPLANGAPAIPWKVPKVIGMKLVLLLWHTVLAPTAHLNHLMKSYSYGL